MNVLTEDLILTANGRRLSPEPDRLGEMKACESPFDDLNLLRRRFDEEGYLFLKSILNRNQVLEFRDFYFERLPSIGREGIVRSKEYLNLCSAQEITNFYESFLGGPVHLHRRKIVRHTDGNCKMLTGAHYDLVYINQGTKAVYTSWIPLGDLPLGTGGLIYLEKSHLLPDLTELPRVFPEEPGLNPGWITTDLTGLADYTGRRWLVSAFEAGDMLIHSSRIIHASTDANHPANIRRLSTDIRYQLSSEKIDERWQNDWSENDGL